MKHVFVVNPAAGKGKALGRIPDIKRIFAGNPDDYCIEITQRPGHATEIAAKYAENQKCRIYSVGGDGTLNEVVNGMAGSGSSLGIIPCGSGNDFIRSIFQDFKRTDLLDKTIKGKEKPIDIARINDRYFINISSAGFDAEVVYNTRNIKRIPGIGGSLAYILGILITVFKFTGNDLRIDIDGKQTEGKVLLAAIANGRYYGGGMLPAPEAKIDDGMLDICIVKPVSKAKILMLFPKLIKGTHGSINEVSFNKGRRIEIRSKNELSINIDGEVIRGDKAVFEIIPKGVNIIIPE